jgi:hypothetical protein
VTVEEEVVKKYGAIPQLNEMGMAILELSSSIYIKSPHYISKSIAEYELMKKHIDVIINQLINKYDIKEKVKYLTEKKRQEILRVMQLDETK